MNKKENFSIAELLLYDIIYVLAMAVFKFIRTKEIDFVLNLKILGILFVATTIVYVLFNKGSFKSMNREFVAPIIFVSCILAIAIITFFI